MIHRIFKNNKVFKGSKISDLTLMFSSLEFNESAPFLQHIIDLVEEYKGPKLTLFDLCSGFGFVGCFLSEVLDPQKMERIYLIDKAFPMQ